MSKRYWRVVRPDGDPIFFSSKNPLGTIRNLEAENAKLREAIANALDKGPTDDSWCIILRGALKGAAEPAGDPSCLHCGVPIDSEPGLCSVCKPAAVAKAKGLQ